MPNILDDLPLPKAGLIGHRGALGIAPENTLSSFIQAAKLGLNWIEFDVQQCQTHEWVVIHDTTLERTTNGKGLVEQVDYDYLKTLDAGSWFNPSFKGEPIPLLSESLACLSQLGLHPNIEIKSTQPKNQAALHSFLEQLQQHWPQTRPLPLVSSSDLVLLQDLRALAPTLPLGYLVENDFEASLNEVLKYQFNTLHCHYSLVNEAAFQSALDKKVPLLIYTVNKPQELEKFVHMGAYGVFSDMTL